MTDDDTRERLVRIETKVDGIIAAESKSDVLHADFELRLRRLERWMYGSIALAAAIGSSAGSVVSKVLSS